MRTKSRVIFGYVAGGYSLVLDPAGEFGVSFGGQSMHGSVGIEGVDTNVGPVDANASGDMVLVRLGFYGTRALGSGWQFVADGHALFGHHSNSSVQVQAGVQWRPNANLAVGLALKATRYTIDIDQGFLVPVPRTLYEYRAVGPVLSVGATF